MRLSSNLLKTFTPLIFLIPSLVIGITIDCSHVRVDGVDFDFSPLDAPHAIWTIEDHPPSYTNTTFTVNICRPLKKTKGVPKDEDCNNNARGEISQPTFHYPCFIRDVGVRSFLTCVAVCAIERLYNPSEDVISVEKTVNIAGEFSTTLGGALDPAWTRLKSSKSTADREKEGVRLELHGGKYQKQDQMAIIEFLCKKDDDGKDTEKRDEDKEEPPNHDDGGSEQGDGHGGTLKYISWETEDDKAKVLRLEWNTKFACEDAAGAGGSQSSSHWGFFTWLIIM